MRWFKWVERKTSLFAKMMLVFSVALLMVCIAFCIAFQLIRNAYNEKIYLSSSELIASVTQNVQYEIDEAAVLSFNLVVDLSFQEMLSQMATCQFGSAEWLIAKEQIQKYLNGYERAYGSKVQQLSLYCSGGKISATGNDIPKEVDMFALLDENAEKIAQANGREVWIPGEDASGKLYLLRDVRERKELTLRSLGHIAMQVDLREAIKRSSVILEESGTTLLFTVSMGDRVIYSNGEVPITIFPERSGFSVRFYQSEEYLCMRYDTKDSPLVYSAALPYSQLMETIYRATTMSAILIAVTFAGVVLIFVKLAAGTSHRIQALEEKFDAFASEAYEPSQTKNSSTSKDELILLNQHFDQMVIVHRKIVSDHFEKQQLLHDAQIKQLQSQIQPHFLYNTLQTIYCFAMIDDPASKENIALIAAKMGNMLHQMLDTPQEVTTLRQDLRFARDYVDIQQFRYGEMLQVSFELRDTILEQKIPMITMQPIVENAIHYTCRELDGVCQVKIYDRDHGEYLQIVVEDNGPGMDEDIIEKLECKKIVPRGRGVGMLNIHKRLQLIFGEDCGISVEREEGKTRVILCIKREELHDKVTVGR